MNKLSVILCALILSSCNTANQKKAHSTEEISAESKRLNDFLDKKFDEQVARNPEEASTLGLKIGYDSWKDRSDENADKEFAIMKATLDSAKNNFNSEALDKQSRLSVKMFEEDYNRLLGELKWRHYNYEINQLEGVHNDLPTFMINIHKIDSLSDASAYIERLNKMPKVFEQTIENLKKSEAKGVIPPYFTFRYVKEDLRNFIKNCDKADAGNVLLTDFTTKLGKLDIEPGKKKLMIAAVKNTVAVSIKPAYQKLLDYWISLEPKAKEKGSHGVWNLPDGDAYYNTQLQWHTTTNMAAEQVYQTGINEVARIQNEMRVIMKKVAFKSDSLQEFFNFVRTAPKFKYTSDSKGHAELLADANRYIDSMRLKLPELFNTLPKAKLVVMEVEKFREKSAGGAFYEEPAEDGSRPGRYYVNNYNMDDEPRYLMEALTYHEAIPGHHMQISIAQELKGVPKFRRHEEYTAYVEGWGLYAEQLGKDAGKYQDPYSDFGRLSMEIFRAARLVVDVGIHNKHWTREQAIAYFMANTANSKGDIEKEIERYFIWPGQATGYKIGMIKILELREKAKKELGNKFDIRRFHDVVLTNGAVSLGTLDDLVNDYIADTKGQSKNQ